MSGCRRRMAGLCVCKGPRTRLPVGASALGFFVLCWLYIFPVYRLPDEKEIVQGVLLQQGKVWRRNLTAVAGFRKLLEDCCNPSKYFAMTKDNSPVGKNLWFDGEFLYSFTIDNETFALFPKIGNVGFDTFIPGYTVSFIHSADAGCSKGRSGYVCICHTTMTLIMIQPNKNKNKWFWW
ncbi:hypothetical protein lerEdw1_000517 [Lerista edwardsae]|nr:hypothetical protein lerEdw1_000517 [Lerista edwardsae]